MKPDPFDVIAKLIETAGPPFPVALIRRLIFRTTSRAAVTHELAAAIGRLHDTFAILAEIVEMNGANTHNKRRDALDDLGRLGMLCRQSAPKWLKRTSAGTFCPRCIPSDVGIDFKEPNAMRLGAPLFWQDRFYWAACSSKGERWPVATLHHLRLSELLGGAIVCDRAPACGAGRIAQAVLHPSVSRPPRAPALGLRWR